MIYGLFMFFVMIVFLYKITIREDKREIAFSSIQSNANSLRGLFAIMIILSHSTMAFESVPTLLVPFAKISTICVGYFFVASGYGLAWSNSNKKDYLSNKFLMKKILYLVCLAVLAYIYLLLIQIINYYFFDGKNIQVSISAWWKSTNWYLKMQGLMYILYFCVNRCIRNKKKACWLLGVILLSICMTCCISKMVGRSYYISELCFWFGIVLYEYGDWIKKCFDKYMKYVMLLIGILCMISLGAFVVKKFTIADCVFHNLLCISACFVMIIFLYYFKIGNVVLSFFNKISLELYICQFGLFDLYKAIFRTLQIKPNFGYVFFVLVSDILIALLAMNVNKIVSNRINKL